LIFLSFKQTNLRILSATDHSIPELLLHLLRRPSHHNGQRDAIPEPTFDPSDLSLYLYILVIAFGYYIW